MPVGHSSQRSRVGAGSFEEVAESKSLDDTGRQGRGRDQQTVVTARLVEGSIAVP